MTISYRASSSYAKPKSFATVDEAFAYVMQKVFISVQELFCARVVVNDGLTLRQRFGFAVVEIKVELNLVDADASNT